MPTPAIGGAPTICKGTHCKKKDFLNNYPILAFFNRDKPVLSIKKQHNNPGSGKLNEEFAPRPTSAGIHWRKGFFQYRLFRHFHASRPGGLHPTGRCRNAFTTWPAAWGIQAKSRLLREIFRISWDQLIQSMVKPGRIAHNTRKPENRSYPIRPITIYKMVPSAIARP